MELVYKSEEQFTIVYPVTEMEECEVYEHLLTQREVSLLEEWTNLMILDSGCEPKTWASALGIEIKEDWDRLKGDYKLEKYFEFK